MGRQRHALCRIKDTGRKTVPMHHSFKFGCDAYVVPSWKSLCSGFARFLFSLIFRCKGLRVETEHIAPDPYIEYYADIFPSDGLGHAGSRSFFAVSLCNPCNIGWRYLM